jgi:hypothetical protein
VFRHGERRENAMGTLQPSKEIELSRDNLHLWPAFQKLYDDGKIMFDKKGRLRYPHGAPVGKLILVKIKKDGTPIYKESASEWFDRESQTAREFVWPE